VLTNYPEGGKGKKIPEDSSLSHTRVGIVDRIHTRGSKKNRGEKHQARGRGRGKGDSVCSSKACKKKKETDVFRESLPPKRRSRLIFPQARKKGRKKKLDYLRLRKRKKGIRSNSFGGAIQRYYSRDRNEGRVQTSAGKEKQGATRVRPVFHGERTFISGGKNL